VEEEVGGHGLSRVENRGNVIVGSWVKVSAVITSSLSPHSLVA
jgi:hypothetical protein